MSGKKKLFTSDLDGNVENRKYSTMIALTDVVQLCRDWPRMNRSIEKFVLASVAVPVLLIGFFNLPWIVFCVCLWLAVQRAFAFMSSAILKLVQVLPFVPSVGPNGHLIAPDQSNPGSEQSRSMTVNVKHIPGRTGLPFIGETVSFVVGSREFLLDKRRQYGDIFATSIDFSGTYLVARRVVCLFSTASNHIFFANSNSSSQGAAKSNFITHLQHNTAHSHSTYTAQLTPYRRTTAGTGASTGCPLKYVAYSGLFGSSSPVRPSVPALAERVLNNYSYLDRWEDVATPIIRDFLRRLVYEGSFSFADRVNELACELVSSIILGMTGLSVPLLAALDSYLSTSRRDSAFNASLKYRKQISNCIHVAVFEEDRRFYARPWDANNNNNSRAHAYGSGNDDAIEDARNSSSILSEVLDMCTDALRTRTADHATNANSTTIPDVHNTDLPTPDTATATDQDQHDLLFILLVEVVYSTLVQQLRTLVLQVAAHHTPLPAQCRANYTQYLSARRLVGNLSGAGLGRLAWGSTIYDTDVECSMEQEQEQEQEEIKSNEEQWSGGIGASIGGIAAYTSTNSANANNTTNNINSRTATTASASTSSIGSFLLSHLPWPLSPSPSDKSSAAASASAGVAANGDNRGGTVHTDDAVSGDSHTHRRSHKHKHRGRDSSKQHGNSSGSDSGRRRAKDYKFPISSSPQPGSSGGGSGSSSGDSELNYSSDTTIAAGASSDRKTSAGARLHRAHRADGTGSTSNEITSSTGSTTAVTSSTAHHTLQTPPVDQYGRRAHPAHPTTGTSTSATHSYDKTSTSIPHIATIRPSMYTTTNVSASNTSNTIPSSPAPSTPTSHHSNTSSASTNSVTRSAGKYTGRYGPRRTPGRAHYVVTPSRGSGSGGTGISSGSGDSSSGGSVFPHLLQNLLGVGGDDTSAMIVKHTADRANSSSSSGGGRGNRMSASTSKSRNSVRHRQQLVVNYITSVKRVVDEARVGTVLAPLPLQYSLNLCTQTHDVILSDSTSAVGGDEHSLYTINKDDLVILVHPHEATTSTTNGNANTEANTTNRQDSPASYYTAASPSVSIPNSNSCAPSHHSLFSLHSSHSSHTPQSPTSTLAGAPSAPSAPSTTTAHTDLGIFSELILSILTHELTTGYQWEVPAASAAASAGNTGALRARSGVGAAGAVNADGANTSATHTHHDEHSLLSRAHSLLTDHLIPYLSPYLTPLTTAATTTTSTSTCTSTSGAISTSAGFCCGSVADHSVPVRRFRPSPDNLAFLIGPEGSVQYGASDDASYGGASGGVDDDMRYYSDGL